MTDPIPCSVQLLVRNDAVGLRTCLGMFRAFAEVIVQDGYSTDGTREVARSFPNVRLLDQRRDFLDAEGRILDFSAVRNEGIAAATYPWILVIDADEVIADPLQEEIRSVTETSTPGVFRVFRRYELDGERIDRCARCPSYQIRLFHRSLTTGYIKKIHEKLALKNGVSPRTLTGELLVPLSPLSALRPKHARYLRMEVREASHATFREWLRWSLYRNLRSIAGLGARILLLRCIPGKGKRMPLRHEAVQMAYLWRVTVWTCPLCRGYFLRKTSIASQTHAI